jgi:hypothetical protein
MRVLSWGLVAAAAIVSAPVVVSAGPYPVDHCQVTTPNDWVVSKSRSARADKKVWVSLMEAPTAAEIIGVETNLKAVKVSEDAHVLLMASTAAFGGLTNKQFHAITKTSPSCVADVTAPAGGADEALARQVALTVAMKK